MKSFYVFCWILTLQVCVRTQAPPGTGNDVNDCIGVTCSGNGICIDGVNTFLCICNSGFTGRLCQQPVDNNVNPCTGVTCSGNGQCVVLPGVNTFDCICDPGFTGALCNLVNINDCTINGCLNGECLINAATGIGECTCDPGFTGDRCQINIDDCTGVNCSGNGICVDGNNTFSCECSAGFEGELCNVTVLDPNPNPNPNPDLEPAAASECSSNPCGLNGQCVEGLNNYTCLCSPGYSGSQCAQVDRFQIDNLLAPLIGGSVAALLLVISTLACIAAVGVAIMKCTCARRRKIKKKTDDKNAFFRDGGSFSMSQSL